MNKIVILLLALTSCKPCPPPPCLHEDCENELRLYTEKQRCAMRKGDTIYVRVTETKLAVILENNKETGAITYEHEQ